VPLGRGIKDVQLLVLNSARELAGIGERGEIYVRSPHLARGYLGDESLTRERFIHNPWTETINDRLYKTGDIGCYLPNGDVEPLGRADNQMKIRGFRIEPREIEAALGDHAAVSEAVIRCVGAHGNKRLIAYVVFAEEQAPSFAELRRFVRDRLPEHMVPSAFVRLEAMPLTPNGKVDHRALPDTGIVLRERQNFVAPSTPVERVLAGIWEEVLDVERIGLRDNFFELGGHSLLATRVISQVREIFDTELPLRDIFRTPTVDGLVNAIASVWGSREAIEAIAETYVELVGLSEDEVRARLLN
jgi:acyl carrier protein